MIMIDANKPFYGSKVYFSGSIKGVPEAEPDFAWKIVQFMEDGGAEVLSKHVAARSPEEMDRIRTQKMGIPLENWKSLAEPWFLTRKSDREWVDEATHLVALVNSPSHGVGMEIERALLKPERGLALTPILCFVSPSSIKNLSFMIKGVNPLEECPCYSLETYRSLNEAKGKIYYFLTNPAF